MIEEWRSIKDFPDYAVSNFGRVKSIKTNKIRVLSKNSSGYIKLNLYKNNKEYLKLVHRLVLKTFGDDNNCLFVNHKDGNKENNNISNLEWCTRSENMIHAYKNNLRIITEDFRIKMSKNNKNRKFSKMHRERLSASHRGLHVGTKNIKAKLCDGEIFLIKKILNSNYYKSGMITQKYIGNMFLVTQSQISAIKLNKVWNYE